MLLQSFFAMDLNIFISSKGGNMDIFEKEAFYYTDVKREYTRVSSGPDVASMCLKKN